MKIIDIKNIYKKSNSLAVKALTSELTIEEEYELEFLCELLNVLKGNN